MNRFVWAAVVVALLLAVSALAATEMKLTLEANFKAFKERFGKSYESREAEASAKAAFAENMKRLPELRARNPHATFGVTKFSDMTAKQFAARQHPGLLPRSKDFHAARVMTSVEPESVGALPPIVDWRTKGVIPPLYNEGECGGANPFIAVASMISSANAIANGKLVACSAQELVSCDTNDDGCCGANFDTMIDWLIQNRGGQLATAASFPYNGSDPTSACKTTGLQTCATVTGYKNLAQTQVALQTAVVAGPIVTALDGSQEAFQMYTGGVITTCNDKPMVDHAVQIVGYNSDTTPPYYILANTWGSDWGIDGGFAYLAMGPKYPNECGILSDPGMSVTVKKN